MSEDEVLSQKQAWSVYDRWIEDERVLYVEESPSLESHFRALTRNERPAPKDWGDSFLCAFAETADLRLVTFDQALHRKGANVLLLE
jgi:predicted nucleic acid-binding protein